MHKNGNYKNYEVLLKVKAQKLKASKGRCEICEAPATCTHHIDGSNDNHTFDNIMAVCYKCHNTIHKDGKRIEKSTSKYLRLYGMKFKEIWKLSGLNDKTAWMVLNYPRKVRTTTLEKFLKNTKIELEDLIKNTVPKS